MRIRQRLIVVMLAVGLVGCGGGSGGSSNVGGGGGTDLELGSMSVSIQGKANSRVASNVGNINVVGLAGASFTKVQFNLPPITQASQEQVRKATYIAYGNNYLAMMYSYATGEAYRLVPAELPYRVIDLDFFPNGRRLALLVYTYNEGYHIATVNADGTGFKVIASGRSLGFGHSVSPDGTKIVVVNYTDGYAGLMTMNADGTGGTQIATGNSATQYTSPDWMSDGRIAFIRSTTGGGKRIYAVNPDGTGLTDLTQTDLSVFAFAVSPSATMKAVIESSGGLYYMSTMPIVGNNAYYQGPGQSSSGDLSWSPDGNQLLYTMNEGGSYNIYLSDLGVTPDRLLIPKALVCAWGPYIQRWMFVGAGGILLPTAAGFLFSQGGQDLSSMVAFDATTRSTAKITNLAPGNDEQSLVYEVTADNLKALKYANSLTGQAMMVIDPLKSATYAKGAIVSFDPQTGRVASVLTHNSAGAVRQSADRTRISGTFLEMWDGKGQRRSLQGVTEVKVNPATGAVNP